MIETSYWSMHVLYWNMVRTAKRGSDQTEGSGETRTDKRPSAATQILQMKRTGREIAQVAYLDSNGRVGDLARALISEVTVLQW